MPVANIQHFVEATKPCETWRAIVIAETRFWAVVLLGLGAIVSAGPAYSLPLPMPAGFAWKQLVPADLFFLLLLVACALPGRPRFRRPRRGVWMPAAALLGAMATAVVASPRPAAGVPDLLRFAYSLVVFALVACLDLTPAHLRRFAIVHSAAALVLAVVVGMAWLRVRFFGIPSALVGVSADPAWSLGSSARAVGPFAHPTTFAVFLHAAFFYVGYLLLVERRRVVRTLAWAAGAVMVVIAPLTYSRAIFAPLVSGAVLSSRWMTRPRDAVRTTLLGVAAAASLALLIVTHVWNVVPVSFHLDRESGFLTVRLYAEAEERFLLYRAALRMFADAPLVGVGPGLFAENLKHYVTLEEFERAGRYFHPDRDALVARWRDGPDPHSSWFGWLARSGLIGIVGIGLVLGVTLRTLWRRGRGVDDAAIAARTAAAFLVGFIALGFIVEIVHLKFFWLFLGLAVAASDRESA